jgi:hypothetical protein
MNRKMIFVLIFSNLLSLAPSRYVLAALEARSLCWVKPFQLGQIDAWRMEKATVERSEGVAAAS